MNHAAILALISDLYAQLTSALQRIEELEARVAEHESSETSPLAGNS